MNKCSVQRLSLHREDVRDIRALVAAAQQHFDSTESQEFLDEVALYAHELPYRIRKWLHDFKLGLLSSSVCAISGFPIDDAKIGATPKHWKNQSDRHSTLQERMLHFMCASLLGEVFGWGTQQDGRITHDVFPIREYEDEQLGFSSKQSLSWHTEDAFHDYRPDFVVLMCLRNPDNIGTHYGVPNYSSLTEEQISYLFGSHYTIKPDNSHLAINNSPRADVSFETIERIKAAPPKQSVLFGARKAPCIRIDPFFMEPAEDPKAQEALEGLIGSIDQNYVECPLSPGDVLCIDNLRVVHGRKSFRARYDGTDRWLKRLLVARDLRKSRDRRAADNSRVII